MTDYVVDEIIAMRLDRFIRRKYNYNLSQSVIEKFLRVGKIKVNGKKAKSNLRLLQNDVVTISDELKFTDTKKGNIFSSAVISFAKKIFSKYLILETKEFIAINKPFGMATQGGSKINISVDHALAYINQHDNKEYRLVHRLDKDTSGILLIAKDLASATLLGEAFKKQEIKKTYLAVVLDKPKKQKDYIESYIDKKTNGSYDLVEENKDGKFAKSFYELLGYNSTNSIIKYTPLTGRMHQLRFHSKMLDCPILGDMKYGNNLYDRMMLHAWQIILPESVFGKEYLIEARLDKFFIEFISEIAPSFLEKINRQII